MSYGNIWRKVAFFVLLFTFGVVAAAYISLENAQCMGVRILSQKDTQQYTQYRYADLNGIILLDKNPAAVDVETSTIYISQNMQQHKSAGKFKGQLTSAWPDVKLYFAADEKLDKVSEAAAEGHTFTLIADLGGGEYMQYNVVFTNLPVINMSGEQTGVQVEEGTTSTGDRPIYTGTISVWDGLYEKTGEYSAKSGNAQWHQRGNSTFWYEKKSWKISFKDSKGNNADFDFLGLDADDDWVLNSIIKDDSRIKEKVVMDLWNEMCADTDYNYNMSQGKYVEVVNGGRYMGIYLLQRRIDAKYLQLDSDTQLVKGGKGSIYYEAVDTTDAEKALQFMEGFRTGENLKYTNIDNWIDVSLFIDAFYMADNAGRYNTFYVIEDMDTRPQVSLVLWDTDFSMGITYDNGFVYRPQQVVQLRRNKNEIYDLAAIYPDLYDKMSQRWQQLRQGVLSDENVLAAIEENYAVINTAYAQNRDSAVWPAEYGGEDTAQSMQQFVKERLSILDDCYANGYIIREAGDEPPAK